MVKMSELKGTIYKPLDRRDYTTRPGAKPGPLHEMVAALEVGQSCESPDPKKQLSFRIRLTYPDRKFVQKKHKNGYTIIRVE